MPTLGDMIVLRAMAETDLPQIADWLTEPHVVRWWLAHQSAAQEMAPYPARLRGDEPTRMLMILEDDRPVGWCQWYRWADYPAEAAGVGAAPDESGIDYAIGDPAAIGRGLGTEVIAALVRTVRDSEPGAGILVNPAADSPASRRVLEKNGFALVSERRVDTEPSNAPMAIYRLAAAGSVLVRMAGTPDAAPLSRLRAEWAAENGNAAEEAEFADRFES